MAQLAAEDVWSALVGLVKDRASHYVLLEDYYKGEQELAIDSATLKSKFGQVFANFRDNLAKPIIEAAEGRVRVQDFTDDGLGKDAAGVWRRNNMPLESKWVHKESMIKGDGFVIVLEDQDGNGGIYPQISEQCAILYNETFPRLKDAAIKWWVEEFYPNEGSTSTDNYIRVNLYFEDRIERYVSKKATDTLDDDLAQYDEYTEADVPAVTYHKVKQVPMFQFAPNYLLSEQKGTSDLEDAMGLIDLINKTFLDMAVASEFTAAPQRWATGVEIPVDPKTGEAKSTFKAGGEHVWTASNDAAKFGQFTAGSLGSFKEGVNVMVEHLAVTTRTPLYYLMAQANYPNGEQLKATEAALRQRVQDHQDSFTPVWAEVLAAALTLDKLTVTPLDLGNLRPRWLPPNAPYATTEHLNELKVHAEVLGVPEEMLWRKAGFTEAEIVEMRTMREDEAALGLDAAAELQAAALIDEAATTDAAATEGGLTPDVAANSAVEA